MLPVMISAAIKVTSRRREMAFRCHVTCCHKLTPDQIEHAARGISQNGTLEFVEML